MAMTGLFTVVKTVGLESCKPVYFLKDDVVYVTTTYKPLLPNENKSSYFDAKNKVVFTTGDCGLYIPCNTDEGHFSLSRIGLDDKMLVPNTSYQIYRYECVNGPNTLPNMQSFSTLTSGSNEMKMIMPGP